MGETESGTSQVESRPLAVRGGVAVVLSVVGNALVVTAVDALGVAPDFRALTLPPVVLLSAAGALGATATYWLVRRRLQRPDRAFVRVALAVLVASFVPDLALLAFDPAATVAGVAVLMLMHVVVAGISVVVLVADGDDVPWATAGAGT